MIGGSIYDDQEDQNIELSRENERLKTQLEQVNVKLLKCEEENKGLKTQLASVSEAELEVARSSQSGYRDWGHVDPFGFLWDERYSAYNERYSAYNERYSAYNEWGQPISTLPDFPRFHPPPKGTIELGFTKEEVLRRLGSPTINYATDFNGEIWSYRNTDDLTAPFREYYNIRFDNGRVTLYRDNSGRKFGDETLRGTGRVAMVKQRRAQREAAQREAAQREAAQREAAEAMEMGVRMAKMEQRKMAQTTPVPHEKTSLEYHRRELDRMGTPPPRVSPPSTDFSKGQRVIYNSREGGQLAKILNIDKNVPLGEEPYVTLKIDGYEAERQTTLDRIKPIVS